MTVRIVLFGCAVALALDGPAYAQECTTVVADSAAEFSGTQGQDGWRYGYYDGNSASPFTPLDFEEFPLFSGLWQRSETICGAAQYCTYVGATSAHPNGTEPPITGTIREHNWAVYRWTSDVDGEVEVTLDAADLDPSATLNDNGVRIHLFIDGVELSNFSIELGGSVIDKVPADSRRDERPAPRAERQRALRGRRGLAGGADSA